MPRSENFPFLIFVITLWILSYGVMQSYRNSFCRDVVLDSFNKASKVEDKILDQICKSKYVRIFIIIILILYNII